jgi:hypothetical protein
LTRNCKSAILESRIWFTKMESLIHDRQFRRVQLSRSTYCHEFRLPLVNWSNSAPIYDPLAKFESNRIAESHTSFGPNLLENISDNHWTLHQSPGFAQTGNCPSLVLTDGHSFVEVHLLDWAKLIRDQ